jgi:hypothetical protein
MTLAGAATREEYLEWLDRGTYAYGFFDPDRPGEVTVLALGVPEEAREVEATVVHELTHALEHQNFGSLDDPGYGDDSWARTGVVEGSAMLVEALYRRRYLGESVPLPRVFDELSRDYWGSSPPGLAVLDAFPYREGARYVHALYERDGWDAVDAAHRRPPATSAAILRPGRAPEGVPVPVTTAPPGPGWRRLASADLGELDTRALLRRAMPEEAARRAADGMAGGGFAVHQRGDAAGCRLPCARRTAGVVAWRMRDAREGDELRSAVEELVASSWFATRAAVAGRGAEVRLGLAPSGRLARRLTAFGR